MERHFGKKNNKENSKNYCHQKSSMSTVLNQIFIQNEQTTMLQQQAYQKQKHSQEFNQVKRLMRILQKEKQKLKAHQLNYRMNAKVERQKFLGILLQGMEKKQHISRLFERNRLQNIKLDKAQRELQGEKQLQQENLLLQSGMYMQKIKQLQLAKDKVQWFIIEKQRLKNQTKEKTLKLQSLKMEQKRQIQDLKSKINQDISFEISQKHVQNAKSYNENLKICLSQRFTFLIQIQENIRQKQAIIKETQTSILVFQNQIHTRQLQLESKNIQKENLFVQYREAEQQFLCTEMESIQLKARLQILQHTLKDLIQNSETLEKQKLRKIDFSRQLQQFQKSSLQCFQKIMQLKLETEYTCSKSKQLAFAKN